MKIKIVITNAHECTIVVSAAVKMLNGDKSFHKCIIRGFAFMNPNESELENLIELILLESKMREQK